MTTCIAKLFFWAEAVAILDISWFIQLRNHPHHHLFPLQVSSRVEPNAISMWCHPRQSRLPTFNDSINHHPQRQRQCAILHYLGSTISAVWPMRTATLLPGAPPKSHATKQFLWVILGTINWPVTPTLKASQQRWIDVCLASHEEIAKVAKHAGSCFRLYNSVDTICLEAEYIFILRIPFPLYNDSGIFLGVLEATVGRPDEK